MSDTAIPTATSEPLSRARAYSVLAALFTASSGRLSLQGKDLPAPSQRFLQDTAKGEIFWLMRPGLSILLLQRAEVVL